MKQLVKYSLILQAISCVLLKVPWYLWNWKYLCFIESVHFSHKELNFHVGDSDISGVLQKRSGNFQHCVKLNFLMRNSATIDNRPGWGNNQRIFGKSGNASKSE